MPSAIATEIALKVGLLEKCEEHGCVYDAMNDFALEDAFRYGETLMTRNDPAVAAFAGTANGCTTCWRTSARDCPTAATSATTRAEEVSGRGENHVGYALA